MFFLLNKPSILQPQLARGAALGQARRRRPQTGPDAHLGQLPTGPRRSARGTAPGSGPGAALGPGPFPREQHRQCLPRLHLGNLKSLAPDGREGEGARGTWNPRGGGAQAAFRGPEPRPCAKPERKSMRVSFSERGHHIFLHLRMEIVWVN